MKKKKWLMPSLMLLMMFSVINVYAVDDCQAVFGQDLIDEVNSIFTLIRIAAPIALLLLTSFDFSKVVFNDNKDGIEKAKNNFLKRSIAVLIIFFAPTILNLIIDIVNENSLKGCLGQFK